MPNVTLYAPKMTKEQKQKIMEGFSKTVGDTLGIAPEAVITSIIEMDTDNVGHGATMLTDILAQQKG
jgi:4-oxalocrotonate tautomerase